MRNLILLIISYLAVGCAGTPDRSPDGQIIPSKVRSITAVLNASKDNCFKIMKKTLINRGYIIKYSDKDTQSVSTEFKDMDDIANQQVALNLSIVNSSKSQCSVRVQGRLYHRLLNTRTAIQHHGMQGSPVRNAWDEMHFTAKEISPKNLTYN